ncbi:MAG TPA: DNA mismatch repair protein MutS, partial [Roseiarcus sp.]
MDAASDSPNAESASARLTPMMAQYFEIKAANPDCLLFYRMGDFYELFFDDAEVASRALGIVLTKRGKHEGEDIRMCGVPVERADDYLNRLIALGHRVAVCEQLEDPAEAKKRGAKSVVKRDVVRLVTPGTITEERLLEPGRARLLVAVQKVRASEGRQIYGLAALDLSTGAVALSEADEAGLAAEIARLEPSEIVASQAVYDDREFSQIIAAMRLPATALARDGGDGAVAERRVCEFYGVETLDGFGAFTRAEIAAAALALAYVKRTQFDARPALSPPTRRARGASLEIDPATRANLELTRTLSGAREGALLATIDLTVTPAGARLLAERLASPLTDPEAIDRRLDSLDFLVEAAPMREAVRRALARAPDFLRALARLGLDRGGPRDLAAIRDGIAAAAALASLLEAAQDLPPDLLVGYARLRADCSELEGDLQRWLAEDLPLIKREGGFVRASASQALDEARALRDQSRRVIAELQASYAEQAGVRQLKIKHNNFLGYYIETPQAAGETLVKAPLNSTFIHRQTMAGAMRFTTNALTDLESRIASAADRALALELEAFERLRQACVAESERLRGFGAALAEIDVAAALAELAVKRNWTRPFVDASLSFKVEGGRHPVVEAALKAAGEPFVANDCDLSGEERVGGRIAIVTGPNMAGKSTYLRQNALIALVAQMGAYVPAA